MSAYHRLVRSELRSLPASSSISEHGITFTRLSNGDGRWSINIMVNRRRHHQVVGLESEGYTRTQAEELVATIKAGKRHAAHGVPGGRQKIGQTIASAADDYLAYLAAHDGKDQRAKAMRLREHLKPHLGLKQIARFHSDDWLAYVTARKAEGASGATINRERSVLLHMLNTMVQRKQIAMVPRLVRQREAEGHLVYLSPAESNRLLKAALKDQSEHAHRFIMIGLFTGMRHASILNLRVRDVDADRRILWVGKDKAGRREQAMPEVLAEYLREATRDLTPDSLLFQSSRAKSGRVYQMNSVFARVVKRAGIQKRVTPHTLRHTAATNAAHAGLDAATIQAMGGWKTRAMAERYTHAASMREAMDTLQLRLTNRRVTRKLPRSAREHA